MDIEKKLQDIQLLLLDVDGVLTDGSINYDNNGNEIKTFSVKDGLGIRMLKDSGIDVGIITGRSSEALLHRCKNLKIEHIFDGISDKEKALKEILVKFDLNADNTCFIGDDFPDIPAMKRVGLSVAVGDAHNELKKIADITTKANGGKGAVREICERILSSKNLLSGIIERYSK